MNLKRALLIFLILVAAVASLTVVSAESSVKVDGIDFKVPDGFTENKLNAQDGADRDAGNFTYKWFLKTFEKNSTYLHIIVMDFNSSDDAKNAYGEITKGGMGTAKIVNGKTGICQEGVSEDGKGSAFIYCKDKCIVSINTNDKSLFEKVVPK